MFECSRPASGTAERPNSNAQIGTDIYCSRRTYSAKLARDVRNVWSKPGARAPPVPTAPPANGPTLAGRRPRRGSANDIEPSTAPRGVQDAPATRRGSACSRPANRCYDSVTIPGSRSGLGSLVTSGTAWHHIRYSPRAVGNIGSCTCADSAWVRGSPVRVAQPGRYVRRTSSPT